MAAISLHRMHRIAGMGHNTTEQFWSLEYISFYCEIPNLLDANVTLCLHF